MENNNKSKNTKYQDYVIKDGKLVGQFEEMYQNFEDPWEQSVKEEWASEKAVALNLIIKHNAQKVIELGCGLGHYTKKIHDSGINIQGVDVSQTAIDKAKANYPDCDFMVADILDFSIYRDYQPDIIVMAEITWYVLDKLENFMAFLKSELPNVHIIHLLTTYPDGVQQYGRDKFTNLSEIMSYFGMDYLEWGEINHAGMNGEKRTFFLGKLKSDEG